MIAQDNLTRFLADQTSVDLAATSDLLLDALELLAPDLENDRTGGLSSLALASALIIVSSVRKETANLLRGIEILSKTPTDPANLGYEKRLALGNAYIQAASGLFRTGLKKEEALAFFRRGVAYLSPIEEQNPETIVPLIGSAYLSAWSVAPKAKAWKRRPRLSSGKVGPTSSAFLRSIPRWPAGKIPRLPFSPTSKRTKKERETRSTMTASMRPCLLAFSHSSKRARNTRRKNGTSRPKGPFAAAVAAGESLGKSADPEDRGNTLVARYYQALAAAFLDSEDTHALYRRVIEAFEEEGEHDDNPEFASFGILFAKLLTYLFVIGEEDEARRFVKEFDILMAARKKSGLDPEGTFSLWLEAAEQELVENEM